MVKPQRGPRKEETDLPPKSESPTDTPQEKYKEDIKKLREMFTDWSEDDLYSVLQESNHDMYDAASRISSGEAGKWKDVPSKFTKKKNQKEENDSKNKKDSGKRNYQKGDYSERQKPQDGNKNYRRGGNQENYKSGGYHSNQKQYDNRRGGNRNYKDNRRGDYRSSRQGRSHQGGRSHHEESSYHGDVYNGSYNQDPNSESFNTSWDVPADSQNNPTGDPGFWDSNAGGGWSDSNASTWDQIQSQPSNPIGSVADNHLIGTPIDNNVNSLQGEMNHIPSQIPRMMNNSMPQNQPIQQQQNPIEINNNQSGYNQPAYGQMRGMSTPRVRPEPIRQEHVHQEHSIPPQGQIGFGGEVIDSGNQQSRMQRQPGQQNQIQSSIQQHPGTIQKPGPIMPRRDQNDQNRMEQQSQQQSQQMEGNNPVVLPSNHAVSDLQVRFGSWGLGDGIQEPLLMQPIEQQQPKVDKSTQNNDQEQAISTESQPDNQQNQQISLQSEENNTQEEKSMNQESEQSVEDDSNQQGNINIPTKDSENEKEIVDNHQMEASQKGSDSPNSNRMNNAPMGYNAHQHPNQNQHHNQQGYQKNRNRNMHNNPNMMHPNPRDFDYQNSMMNAGPNPYYMGPGAYPMPANMPQYGMVEVPEQQMGMQQTRMPAYYDQYQPHGNYVIPQKSNEPLPQPHMQHVQPPQGAQLPAQGVPYWYPNPYYPPPMYQPQMKNVYMYPHPKQGKFNMNKNQNQEMNPNKGYDMQPGMGSYYNQGQMPNPNQPQGMNYSMMGEQGMPQNMYYQNQKKQNKTPQGKQSPRSNWQPTKN